MEQTELIVIGAGPAGIQAAIIASELGLEVTLIDSQPSAGGHYFKQIPQEFNIHDTGYHQKQESKLFRQLENSTLKFLGKTLVWGISHNPKTNLWQLTLQGDNWPSRIETPFIVIATGAYDRSIPFPGWDMPGIITAGAAQIMIKNQGILPGKHVIVTETGPLQLAVASNLFEAGAKVQAVLECNQNLLFRGIPHLPSIWGQWRRLEEGFQYAGNIIKTKTPYRIGWSVIKADGFEKVEEVTIGKLDTEGYPIHTTNQNLAFDAVVVGFVLTPSTEFFRLLDVDVYYSQPEGVFLPKRNDFFQTNAQGIYPVGDCAGIGGANLALLEGQIAAFDISVKSGLANSSRMDKAIQQTKARILREQKFARMLGDVFSIPQGLFTLAQPDTIIYRYEHIKLAEVQEAVNFGAQSVTDIKNITRRGMENCQGRTCDSILAQILSREAKCDPQECHYLNIRPPVHPISISIIEEKDYEVLA